MFSSWNERVCYLLFAAAVLIVTARLSRQGLEQSLERPVAPGFGPPCSLWQAWKLFCGLFWEQVLLLGVVVSCSVRVWMSHWRVTDLLILAVIVATFPLQEYLVHMFVLHRRPTILFGHRFESVIALVHRVHHRDPWHMERAINPPLALVTYAVGLPIVWFPFLPRAQAMTGIAGSWLMLLLYEWVHLLIHTSHVPRNRLFKRIWRNHRLHHFKNEHFWFNVSTLGVDTLFGTEPRVGSVPTSPSCLTLSEQAETPAHSGDRVPLSR